MKVKLYVCMEDGKAFFDFTSKTFGDGLVRGFSNDYVQIYFKKEGDITGVSKFNIPKTAYDKVCMN